MLKNTPRNIDALRAAWMPCDAGSEAPASQLRRFHRAFDTAQTDKSFVNDGSSENGYMSSKNKLIHTVFQCAIVIQLKSIAFDYRSCVCVFLSGIHSGKSVYPQDQMYSVIFYFCLQRNPNIACRRRQQRSRHQHEHSSKQTRCRRQRKASEKNADTEGDTFVSFQRHKVTFVLDCSKRNVLNV